MKLHVFCLWLAIAASAMAADKVVEKPTGATDHYECTRAHFGIWVDPTAWKPDPHPTDLFKMQFLHLTGGMGAVLDAGPARVPFDSMPRRALEALRETGYEMKLVSQETRLVCGRQVLFLTFKGLFRNLPDTVLGYYYTGPEGTVQSVVFLPNLLAEKFESVAEDFLNGLEIGEAGEKVTAPPAPAPKDVNLEELNATVPYLSNDPTSAAIKDIRAGYTEIGVAKMESQAKKGDPRAEVLLALFYDEGKLVARDPAKAVALMKKAVASGLPLAKQDFAQWCYKGHLVPKDPVTAQRLLREAAEAGLASAQSDYGVALASSDPVAAFGWVRKAADQRFPLGEFQVGICYRDGTGVPKDKAAAIEWIRKASDDGCNPAQVALSEFYITGTATPRRPDEMEKLLRKLAEAGNAEAQNNLSACLWWGKWMDKNRSEALQWLREAAELGNPQAEQFLGRLYWEGTEIHKDPEQSALWSEKAASQGLPGAQCMIGSFYEAGIGVKKNITTAADWYKKSAEHGNRHAEVLLGLCYLRGKGVPKDVEAAMQWIGKSADAGDKLGESLLGDMYAEGAGGVGADWGRAFPWFQKAAAQGNARAEMNLGIALLHGLGAPQNVGEGLEWLHKAAEQNEPMGEFVLGLAYERGTGVPVDGAEAVKWFRASALQGHPRGENALGYAFATGNGISQDFVEAYKWYTLAMSQDVDAESKSNATINMKAILPKMTPEQIDEGKKRAAEFVPVLPQRDEYAPSDEPIITGAAVS